MMKAVITRWKLIIIGAAVLIISLCIMSVVKTVRDDELSQQIAEIRALENRQMTLQAAIDDGTSEAVRLASGLDSSRIAKDDGIAKSLIEKICSWDSKETYDSVRSGVMKEYKLDANSTFMQVFMPEIRNVNVGDHEVNEIDASGLNMAYVGMQSNVIGISGDAYTYLTIVTTQSSDKSGARAEGRSLFQYTVNGAGEISALEAYNIGAGK